MIVDGQLSLVPLGGPLSLVGAAGQTFASQILDLLGEGVGQAPTGIIGSPAIYGSADAKGIGPIRPELAVSIGTAIVAVGASTLNCALQGAVDLGAGGNYQPGAWNTFAETGAMAAANLTANTLIARFPFLPPFPFNLRPRFVRLLFSPSAGGSFTAGSIASALVTLGRDDYSAKNAANNYRVQ